MALFALADGVMIVVLTVITTIKKGCWLLFVVVVVVVISSEPWLKPSLFSNCFADAGVF